MTDTEKTEDEGRITANDVIGFVAMVLVVVLFIVGIGTTIWAHWETKDAVSWKRQAAVAGDAAQIAEFTDNCLAEMERIGMDSGWTTVIWKTPSRDMAVTYAKLQQIADRARFVDENPELNVLSQAQILEDLRYNLRWTKVERVNWWCMYHGVWFLLPVFVWWTWVGCVIVYIIACAKDSQRG